MAEKEEKILKEALARFDLAEKFDHGQRVLAVEDMRFAHAEDGQWSEDDISRRGNRPRYTFNRVIGVIKQITGDHKQNRSQIKVDPESTDSNDKTAKIFSGLIRKIQKSSKAHNAYDNSFDEKTAGGYGGWRILTEFKDDSFDQDIVIKPIKSAVTSHYIDPSSIEYDGRDSMYQFLITTMAEDAFKVRYPNAVIQDFSNDRYSSGYCANWFTNGNVRIAEYWVKTPITKTLALLSDGRTIYKEDEEAVLDELKASQVTIMKERKVKTFNVEMYKMNGAEILEGPKKWAGKYIPLVPDYGEQITIEDQRFTRGIVRFAKDGNRTYNYARSTDIETYALTPKDPIWETLKQRAGHEASRQTFNRKNQPFMLYNTDAAAPGPPQRTGAPSVQQAGIEIARQSVDDLHATTSMYPPAMGNAPQLLSEKSVKSQAEKGDIGAYIYQDNHEKSLAFTGEILLDLIPKIYDTPQMVQILEIDGKAETVQINTEQLNEINETVIDKDTGKPVIVNDLSLGKYGVSVETGPAFSTQKDESAQQLIELAAASPVFEQLTPDLIAKNLNIVEGEEFTKRLRKYAIQQGIADPTDEEIEDLGLNVETPPDPQATALVDNVNMQTEKLKSDIEKQDAQTQETLVKTQSQTITAYKDLIDALQKQAESGIPISPNTRRALVNQADLMNDAQDVLNDEMPNSEEAADLAQMAQQPPAIPAPPIE